jgi:hypothetical protein
MTAGMTITARRAGLIAVALALGGALAALAQRQPRGGSRSATEPATYRCGCGAEYRVSGTDRHRVYWPADASGNDPVMGDRCARCDAPLPAGRETVVSA